MKNHGATRALTLTLVLWAITPPASLFAASTIFTTAPQFVIDSIDFDESGNLFYLRSDFDFGAATPESTVLIKRTKASGYSDPATVFDFGARKFGSFVTTTSSRVYFGESSDGTIRSVALDGSNPMLHATIAFNFDLAISPGGDAFVSANSSFGQTNEILHVDLGTGVAETVITNTNDFSGPLAFDSAGNLFYGGTGSPFAIAPPTDIFRFTGAEIATALATTTPIDLAAASPFSSTAGNSHFEFAAGFGLFSHPPDGVSGGLILVDPTTGAGAPLSGAPVTGTLGSIAFNGASLYGISTDFSTNTSAFVLIPEPSRPLLSMIALAAAILARRNFFTLRK